ncbi:MAG: hypothetical protein WBY94_08080 [Polyangiaceae bacterium]
MIEGSVTGDSAIVLKLERLPTTLRGAVVNALKREWFRLQAAVVTGKLSGDPLHRRTGVLASSINVGGADTATEFVDEPADIIGRIGTKVRYGYVHEYGGTFTIPSHDRRVESRLGKSFTQSVREHQATFPQRSFLRSTLDEQRPAVLAAIRAAVSSAIANQ